jgi:selenocysteine-specific elongation factor
MKHIIVGTAGHIDHGKTALVKALTGIDADRLEEEKRRGITIDLGFAHLLLTPTLRLGFVDVPGHERFIKNMLAGVGGIDLVLFVIAADESIKPQTREHFDICRLLGIGRGVIALTKADLVDADILGLVKLEVEELVQGSFLDGAPMVPVSSVTGAGLDQLRGALAMAANAAPEKSAAGYFRLPIDRVFSVKGFGTVATGTLISGSVAREQAVEAYPHERRLRVRGVEVHGAIAERAVAGERTAVNLADIEPAELARGDVLSEPGRFRAVTRVDCRLQLLASAKPLKHRAPVHFHSGTAEIGAEVRLLGGATVLRPGGEAYARLVLKKPALLLPGDRFIIRMFSPVVTIGGGTVLDLPTNPRFAGAAERLALLAGAGAPARIALLVRETEFGAGTEELVARTGLREDEVAAAAARAPLLAVTESWYVDSAWFQAARTRLVNAVREFHRLNPLAPGIAKQDLRAREMPQVPLFLLDALLGLQPATPPAPRQPTIGVGQPEGRPQDQPTVGTGQPESLPHRSPEATPPTPDRPSIGAGLPESHPHRSPTASLPAPDLSTIGVGQPESHPQRSPEATPPTPDRTGTGAGQPESHPQRSPSPMEIVVEGETVRLRGHRVVLQEDEEQARAALERTFETAGLAVPALAEALAKSGVEARRARTLLGILLREKRLLRINEELVFHSTAIERLRQMLAARKSQRFGVGEFKEWTGISRKYAIPLLEYLDRERLTRRDGDQRLIL